VINYSYLSFGKISKYKNIFKSLSIYRKKCIYIETLVMVARPVNTALYTKLPSIIRQTVKNSFLLILLVLISCNGKIALNEYLTETIPNNIPLPYKPELIPDGMLIHSGIFSPDLNEYYFTISDKHFQQFDVKMVQKEKEMWSKPKDAFFNTTYNEHGMSFSPDGKYIYFSSTRPAEIDEISNTWHIWCSEKSNDKWSEPEFVDIPNLRDKLVSHPSLTKDGTLYFHAGTTDYSELYIYCSKQINGKFADAIKLPNEINFRNIQNTPYISPDESYILFEATPDLYISYKDKGGHWLAAKPLNGKINKHGKGNPYITPDKKYLFYVAGMEPNPDENWSVYWVSIKTVIDNY